MATMSRRIPPTPVAAPWNGSTAEGWLWLSTLNATASPSPRSITPAFSPGPCGAGGLVRITVAPIQVEAWVDLDEQRPARLVERPDREVLAKLRQEGDSAQRAGADLPRADELEDGLRPPAALELGPAEAGAGQLRLPRPPEGRLRVGEPRLPLARDELPRAGHLVDAAGPEE